MHTKRTRFLFLCLINVFFTVGFFLFLFLFSVFFFFLFFFFLLLWHGWWWVCSVFVGRIANSEGNDNVGSDRTTQVWMDAEATASTVWPFQSVTLSSRGKNWGDFFCMPSLFALGTGLLFFFSIFFFFFNNLQLSVRATYLCDLGANNAR